jgi:hypothetical protein
VCSASSIDGSTSLPSIISEYSIGRNQDHWDLVQDDEAPIDCDRTELYDGGPQHDVAHLADLDVFELDLPNLDNA